MFLVYLALKVARYRYRSESRFRGVKSSVQRYFRGMNLLMEGGIEGRARSIKLGSLKYRRDFHEVKLWNKLASDRNIKLPMWHTGPTSVKMRKWLIKLGISEREYFDWFGGKSLMEFTRANPKWPLRAWIGLLLEYLESKPREFDKQGEEC